MRAIVRRLGRVWDALVMMRYRGRRRKFALDEDRYEERQSRHDAGLFEPPRPGGF